ncbi:hypothetical protein Goshw_011050 [Gossypium schwendimanii]|uniref:Uncharacterized protein n=2 Tax=Gossypium TaxID=3633 RepID=A0A7J9LFC2_GOSSC|nr:hypothetical protein [Gossypium aridum]MBA0857351.1 hypothetical protein [Gossypium schwendimanii]
MEEIKNCKWNPWECLKSIEIVTIWKTKSDPSFLSCIITFYILILLYFPPSFSLNLQFSLLLLLSASLLLSLLRLCCAIQRIHTETIAKTSLVEAIKTGSSPKEMSFEERFVEWDVRAPLEVIYEDYEGEEALDRGIERYTSLSRRYSEPEPDSLFSEMEFPVIREWVSSDKRCWRWEEEEDREGLIEIALDFHGEEDSLIEIDISSINV